MTPETRRVLLVAGPAAGGLRAHVAALARHLAQRGWPVTVVAPGQTLEPLRGAEAGAGIRLVTAPIGAPAAALAAHLRLRRLAADHDVLHAHGLRAAAITAVAGGSRPLIATWHNAPPTPGGWRNGRHSALERLVARRSDLVLAVSPDLGERAGRAGARRVRLIQVPGPARVGPPSADRSAVREALGIPAGRPLVLTVARLTRQKALDQLVAAATPWRAATDPVVVVAGEGALRGRLEALVATSGAPVRLVGERRDVPDLLAAADAFALPSRWEGWPLALAEALRAGLPAVTTDLPGTRRLAGDAALYVPVDDPVALRDALHRVTADDELRAALATAGRRRAAEWQTLEEATDEILADYLKLS